MRPWKTAILTSAAIAGLTGLAFAAAPAIHEMTVEIPGGGVAHIRYTGDVPPKVNFAQSQVSPVAMRVFAPAPFADMERITAMMDQQMAQMLYQARLLQQAVAQAPLNTAEFQGVPGGSSYSFISTVGGSGFCVKSMQITSSNGAAPKVISHSEGNCGDKPTVAAPAQLKTTPASGPLQTISYKPQHSPAHPRQGV